MEIKRGGLRVVIMVGKIVIKFPRFKSYYLRAPFGIGRDHNKTERKCWRRYKDNEHLAPIYFADPFGLMVIMARAQQFESGISYNDMFNAIDFSNKKNIRDVNPCNCGIYKGNVVIIDYGLWNVAAGKWINEDD